MKELGHHPSLAGWRNPGCGGGCLQAPSPGRNPLGLRDAYRKRIAHRLMRVFRGVPLKDVPLADATWPGLIGRCAWEPAGTVRRSFSIPLTAEPT